ncbi:MAG: hypothetical protein COA88_09880 [Kordia sp.]|nr:MAG: hypothetical protein COA88_09880 [Kordia sp.]
MPQFFKIIIILLLFQSSFSQKKWSLNDCIKYALENNISVKKSKISIQVQQENNVVAKSNKLPSINSTLSQSTNIFFSNLTNNNNHSTNWSILNTSYTLYNGAINNNTIRKAVLNKRLSENNHQLLENSISINVTNAYLDYLLTNEFIKIAENQLVISKSQLEIITKRITAGLLPEAEVFNSEASVAQDEETLLLQKNNKKLSLLRLKRLMQMPVKTVIVINEYNELQESVFAFNSVEGYFNSAKKNRTEVSSSELLVEVSKTDIDIAKGNFKPIATLGITVLIFTGNRNKGLLNISKLNLETSELNLEETKFNLRQQIEEMYVDISNVNQTLKSTDKTLLAREITLKYAQKSVKVGRLNNFDFDKIKNDYIMAKANYARAKFNYFFKNKILHLYTLGKF